MAAVTLRIDRPSWWLAHGYWDTVSETVMDVLCAKFGVIRDYEEQCGWQLDSFLTDDQLRLLTLHVFNSTLPAMVEKVAKLVIIGSGECPSCGSNNRESESGYHNQGEYGYTWNVTRWRCRGCGEVYDAQQE